LGTVARYAIPELSSFCQLDPLLSDSYQACRVQFLPAASSRRNRRAVRACPRMTQKRADLVRGFGREDVFELARLLLDFRLAIQSQAVSKQPLREPVPANDVGGALAPRRVSSTNLLPSAIGPKDGFK